MNRVYINFDRLYLIAEKEAHVSLKILYVGFWYFCYLFKFYLFNISFDILTILITHTY